MKMKKLLTFTLAYTLIFSFSACGASGRSASTASQDTAPQELIVFAASSMTEALTELGDSYMTENPNINIIFNFDSSGTLKTQIQEGADVDIFISAGQKQMDQLDIDASSDINSDRLDFILEGTRLDILENKVALVVPSGNPTSIHSFNDMIDSLNNGSILLAMGNSDVPVGQYTLKILNYYGLSEGELAAAGLITYGTNVKEVTTQVSEAVADCGIIYQTDAFSAGLTIVDTATNEMCGQVIYPAAVMNVSKNPEAAKSFLEYLTTDSAETIFEEVGFTPVK